MFELLCIDVNSKEYSKNLLNYYTSNAWSCSQTSQGVSDGGYQIVLFSGVLHVTCPDPQQKHCTPDCRRLGGLLLSYYGAYWCTGTGYNCVIYNTDIICMLVTSSFCESYFIFRFAVEALKPLGFTCIVQLHIEKIKHWDITQACIFQTFSNPK